MKKFHLTATLLITLISMALLPSCRFHCVKGSGHHITQNLTVNKFTHIYVDGGYKVVLKQDSSYKVSIEADDNLMQYIHAESDGGELHIHNSRKNFCSSGEIIVNVGVGNLEELRGSGSVVFSSDGKLNTKDLKIKLSGSGKTDLDLTAANVITESSGSSEITLKGQATSNKVDLMGSGKIYALDFVVGAYDIHTTGASHCEINVLNSLDVNTTGASEIQYRGNPSHVNSDKTGAATITKVN
ncbi:MAG: head GIN domain-containing protein [Sphingobacteriales bacterium]